MTRRRSSIVDWVVVGSGFGGSVSALRLAEKGYSVAVLECGSRFRDEDFAASTLREPRRYFWWPKWGMRGVLRMTFFKDVFVVSGSGVGGGSLGYANTLYRARPELLRGPAVGRARQLGGRARPPLRHRRADARRRRVRGHGPGRRAAQGIRRGHRRRRDLHQHQGRGLLRPARGRGRRPLLRRRGPGADRLHALRQLHGRLPPRRQEHADEELPLVRREARREDRPRTPGDRDPPARRRRRLRRLRDHPASAPGSWFRKRRQHGHGRAASSSPPAPSAPTTCSPTASTAAPCRGSRTGSAT